METKYCLEYRTRGTVAWYPVPHGCYATEVEAWEFYDRNLPFYSVNYDLQVTKIVTSKEVIDK